MMATVLQICMILLTVFIGLFVMLQLFGESPAFWRWKRNSIPAFIESIMILLIPVTVIVWILSDESFVEYRSLITEILTALAVLVFSLYLGKVKLYREEHWFSSAWEKARKEVLMITSAALLVNLIATWIFLTVQNSKNVLLADVLTAILFLTVVLATVWGLRVWSSFRILRDKELKMEQWLTESRDYMNVIRSQRHDYNLHVHALVGLIENGEFDKAKNYMSTMASEASDVNDIMPVGDAVLGSMLYNMREEARRKGSDILYSITYDMHDVLCSGFVCNKIIGNLLQNAIDALKTEEDKAARIRMKIFKRRGNTVIQVENRFTGDKSVILHAFEAGFTTKKHHDGIGLSMVQRSVLQENGSIYPEFESDLIRFVVTLPNRVSLEGITIDQDHTYR